MRKAARTGAVILCLGLMTATSAYARSSDGEGCGVSLPQSKGARVLGDFLGGLAGAALSRAGLNPGNGFDYHLRDFLSSAIACSLTKKEQGQAADTETASLNSGVTGKGSRRDWASTDRNGVRGTSVVEKRNKGDDGNSCAITKTMITDENGEEKSVRVRRCQLADGSWDNGSPV
jgi:hypothetical protein